MMLSQTKEREYRFKLALRMGLPIFALILALIFHTLITNYTTLQTSFYIEAILLLLVSVYFIFFLIYRGFDVKITDSVTKTFTREYLYQYLQKEIRHKKDCTLILISIDNLNDINILYGIKNGDKVLKYVADWIMEYLKKEGIENIPIGHIKGGDFIIGLEGFKDKYSTLLELLCLKSNNLNIDDIEVKISGVITDTSYSKDLNYLIENLFELQNKNKNSKYEEEIINPNELELLVIDAIENKNLLIMSQEVYNNADGIVFRECYVKLKGQNNKIIHPKTYLKVINKLGLGVSFDLMVLEEILKNCIYEENIYAVNILPTSLRNDKFLAKTKELLKEYAGTQVMFVLNEMQYYSYISRYNSIIKSLKSLGVLIAIDRLGAIHTSFLYLRELDIDVVRFDTYYSNIDKISQNRSIIDGFNVMAHENGVKTWIKNIEDEATYILVKEMDIDYVEGKYLSKIQNNAN
ncbi:bifunctional diguanylate cyclase/phosphodiesterase [Sulfurimonas autotrophica]|uniref:Diguanylate cyclase/phosphodiesterase n=1 Tax=Sulfurimonas autotrophica (strain ATCC BAA-671 / DSM 16294 / JCM 11897 / OK10) TaxID=563040 RepID=E0UP20_SULAO|nr:GGDEF domain-containing protein [Sulfurimonas autotrophica]ADN08053.1 diguanylate cyclase/phosphodiesterase [Sulfurimonas autotrophica DSM 16294]